MVTLVSNLYMMQYKLEIRNKKHKIRIFYESYIYSLLTSGLHNVKMLNIKGGKSLRRQSLNPVQVHYPV